MTSDAATTSRHIVWRILLPVIVLLATVVAVFVVLVYSAEQKQLDHSLATLDNSAQIYYRELLHEHNHKLAALARNLTARPDIRRDLKQGDRDRLYRDTLPLFRDMQKRHDITHLYFHDANLVNLLRLHEPERHGDRINRATALQAQRSGKPASGVELGPLGTLTLRRVEPITDGTTILGYTEIGEELAPIIQDLKDVLKSDVYVLIDKRQLKRAGWQQGQTMLDRDGDWNRLPDMVISEQTADLPAALVQALRKQRSSFPLQKLDITMQKAHFRAVSHPLIDSANRQIGHVILMKNINTMVGKLWQRVIIASILAIFITLLLCILLYRLLRGVERDLQRQDRSIFAEAEALRKSTQRLIRAQQLARLTSWEWNIAEDHIHWTDNAGDFFHDKPLPARLDDWLQRIHPEDRTAFRHHLHQALHDRQELRHEQRLMQKNGSTLPVAISASGHYRPDGSLAYVTGAMLDISDRQNLENQFFKAQKMEALGILVGGIAHDFNNILMGILGSAYLAKRRCENSEALQKLGRIETLGQEAARTIADLLAFARRDTSEMKRFELTPFIKEIHKMLQAGLPENIKLRLNYAGEPMPVLGDAAQIHLMLVNLVANARDAVEQAEHPQIEITLRPWQADAAFRERHPETGTDHWIRLSVQDNGQGMSEAEQEKIFEPFFTTKGQGSGLGLSMVHGGMQRHHGVVEVACTSGEGCVFHLYFPRHASDPDSPKIIEAPLPLQKAAGSLTLLVVDDQQLVRETATEMLREIGHRAISAADGQQAVALFREHAEEIDLVLTDVIMPVMDGVAAMQEIHRITPTMPCIFMTGYDKDTLDHRNLPSRARVLAKPFTIDQLSRLIDELQN